MDFSTKYAPPKRTDFGPYPERSFGEVVWTGAFFPCHNWPCQKLTGWAAYIEGEEFTVKAQVCSEECLRELANGCKILVQPLSTAQEDRPRPLEDCEQICELTTIVELILDNEVMPDAKAKPVIPPNSELGSVQPKAEPNNNPPLAQKLSSFKMDDTLKRLLGKT